MLLSSLSQPWANGLTTRTGLNWDETSLQRRKAKQGAQVDSGSVRTWGVPPRAGASRGGKAWLPPDYPSTAPAFPFSTTQLRRVDSVGYGSRRSEMACIRTAMRAGVRSTDK